MYKPRIWLGVSTKHHKCLATRGDTYMVLGKVSKWLGLGYAFVSFFTSGYAADLNAVYDQLKDNGENYKVVGAVCEQVAKLMLESEFPSPKYEIKTGISYTANGKILGELDVVVFSNENRHFQRAVGAYEVKCCRDNVRSLHKAKKQLARFKAFLRAKLPLDFYLSSKREIHFSPNQFDEAIPVRSISYKDSGFDKSLDFSLDELMVLRERLMSCQASGNCERAY